MKFEIICEDLPEFVDIIAMLVREGICFEASTSEGYIIDCTGGF